MLRVINEGTVEGLSQAKAPPTHDRLFYQNLRHSNEVFAAFKVHQMGEDMAAKLFDASGNLKPFDKWLRDVSSISSHQVGAWLRTEYDTAVIRAHAAADWQEFERNKDIFPNLRWMPTTSPEPESTHAAYWRMKLTLPVDDPFWNEHHPGDRWNCKCSLEATDEPVVRPAGLEPTQPQRGLENNPGKDGHTFSDKHPYFPSDCSHCFAYKKGGFTNRLKAFFLNREKDCYNCPFINSCIEPCPISKYDKKKWEHTYVAPNGEGFVVTEKERIEEGRASKNEAVKFQKELHMCKVAADNGHEVQFLKGTGRKVGQTYDIILDSLPTDLKSTGSAGNLVKHIRKAYKEQGAKAVLLELESHEPLLYKRLNEAKRKYDVKIYFYFNDEEVIRQI